MNRMIGRLLAIGGVLALAACMPQPYPLQYTTPAAPPPLQPYMGPPYVAAAPAPHRYTRRHYVKRRHYHRQVRCPCLPTK